MQNHRKNDCADSIFLRMYHLKNIVVEEKKPLIKLISTIYRGGAFFEKEKGSIFLIKKMDSKEAMEK